MASFLSMQYDSDSDSADDLDFEPASDQSSDSDNISSDVEENMELIEGDIDTAQDDNVSAQVPSTETDLLAKPAKKTRKKAATATVSAPAEGQSETTIAATATVSPSSSTAIVTAPSEETSPTVGTDPPTATMSGTPIGAIDPAAPGEPVKKKKGPKKGTKYKKRVPKVDGATPAGKTPKAPKMTKKAAAAAAAAAEAAKAAQFKPPNGMQLGFQNTVFDMDHPLESFRWPYSPFTAEFKSQHQARNKMANDLGQAIKEITDTNDRASWHLRELDHKLQMSRQDLKTSLDEIQFRKSQLRDMSLLAVDIVKKLSSPRSQLPPRRSSLPSGAMSGNESGTGDYPSSYQTTASQLDGDHMDVDGIESGGEPCPQHDPSNPGQPGLKDLNEGNVRSFLEKIRELEQAQRHVMV
ncbi:hypothetical protein BGX34_003356 [Mortierella sp. NVP85]|nr:hypothetical protein BGX34_003356 [Mortierella sp. NVP85]